MSSLLDRYIYAVERHLPQSQRHDIGAELRETIHARVDEESAALGRSLTDEEVGRILTSVGRPVVVAGRYAASPYVIGPAVFPYYRATIRALLWIGAPIGVVATAVSALAAPNPWLGAVQGVGTMATSALSVFGLVTLMFWRFDQRTPDLDSEWDPAELPEVPQTSLTASRAQSIGQAVSLGMYLLLWVGIVPLAPILRLAHVSGDGMPQLAPVWQTVFVAVAALFSVELVIHLLNAWQPRVPRWRVMAHMACDLVALGIIYFLLSTPELVIAPAEGAWAGKDDLLNDVTKVGLLVLGFLVVLELFKEGTHLRASSQPPGTTGGAPPSTRPGHDRREEARRFAHRLHRSSVLRRFARGPLRL